VVNLVRPKVVSLSGFSNYIIINKIPFFIELMDKVFYLNIQLVEYFIMPYYSLPMTDVNIASKKLIVSLLDNYLNFDIYEQFINTCKENTSIALENFYDVLIAHFDKTGVHEFKINVEQTKIDYFERKGIDSDKALKEFLPIPDENPNKRLIHLLPNYNAFTNIVARSEKFKIDNNHNKIKIIHDEQKQFNVIFESALQSMIQNDSDIFVKDTIVKEKGVFNIDSSIDLTFEDSKTNKLIQVSDLLAGVIMRFWSDFMTGNQNQIDKYLPIIKELIYPIQGSTIGINFVVSDFKHLELMKKIKSLPPTQAHTP
jgi:hypothetical protein